MQTAQTAATLQTAQTGTFRISADDSDMPQAMPFAQVMGADDASVPVAQTFAATVPLRRVHIAAPLLQAEDAPEISADGAETLLEPGVETLANLPDMPGEIPVTVAAFNPPVSTVSGESSEGVRQPQVNETSLSPRHDKAPSTTDSLPNEVQMPVARTTPDTEASVPQAPIIATGPSDTFQLPELAAAPEPRETSEAAPVIATVAKPTGRTHPDPMPPTVDTVSLHGSHPAQAEQTSALPVPVSQGENGLRDGARKTTIQVPPTSFPADPPPTERAVWTQDGHPVPKPDAGPALAFPTVPARSVGVDGWPAVPTLPTASDGPLRPPGQVDLAARVDPPGPASDTMPTSPRVSDLIPAARVIAESLPPVQPAPLSDPTEPVPATGAMAPNMTKAPSTPVVRDVPPVQSAGLVPPDARATSDQGGPTRAVMSAADTYTVTVQPSTVVSNAAAAPSPQSPAPMPSTPLPAQAADLAVVVDDRPGNPLVSGRDVATASEKSTQSVPPPTQVQVTPTAAPILAAAAIPSLIEDDRGAEPSPSDLIAATSSADPARTNVTSAPAVPLPRAVVVQLMDIARSLPDGPVELTLNPEELGRVRMSLSPADTSMTVALTIERPETADLMRRHLGMLEAEFQALGYHDVSFSFAQGDGWRNADGSEPATPDAADDSPMPTTDPADTDRARITLGGGVDLRL